MSSAPLITSARKDSRERTFRNIAKRWKYPEGSPRWLRTSSALLIARHCPEISDRGNSSGRKNDPPLFDQLCRFAFLQSARNASHAVRVKMSKVTWQMLFTRAEKSRTYIFAAFPGSKFRFHVKPADIPSNLQLSEESQRDIAFIYTGNIKISTRATDEKCCERARTQTWR